MGFLKALSCCLVVFGFFGSKAEAQAGDVNRRLQRLESQVQHLSQRVINLEAIVGVPGPGPGPGPGPLPHAQYACMIVDSGYSKTFVAVASNMLDAEFQARESCQGSVHSSYCGNVSAKCDSTLDNPRAANWVCVVTDSGYGKAFRGEGRTAVEAEAKAKQSCQQSVHSSYCGGVSARCSYN